MRMEVGEGGRRAEALDILRRGIGMEPDREQLALDQIRLGWLAGADRDVGLAHREVEVFIGDDHGNPDLRVERGEFMDPRNQPVDAKRWRRLALDDSARHISPLAQLTPPPL